MEKKQSGMYGWLLQRITGILLIVGMIVHYLYLHFFSKGNLDFEYVASRLQSPWWVIFDTCLLAVIIYHGFYGLSEIINDYNPKPYVKNILSYIFLFTGIFLFLWGFYALLIFTRS